MHPPLTIFCPFTRLWCVDRWLRNLAAVEHDPALTNLCFIVDGDQHLIANLLKKFAEEKGYRSFHVKINEDWSPHETRLSVRRMRIADVKNQSKDLIAQTDADIIISFEDDTVFDRLGSFETLYKPLLDFPEYGYVEGVQMGRWGAKIIGAWQVDNVNKPMRIETLLAPKEDDGRPYPYEEITAGGFYGYATRREQYLNHEYYTSSAQPWGPDVNFGLWVIKQNQKCLIDWSMIFGHHDYNSIAYPDNPPGDGKLAKVVFDKDVLTGKWQRSDHETDRF